MSRRALLSLLFLAACDAPKHALVQRCTREFTSNVTRCTLTGQSLSRNQVASFDANTKNQKVKVTGTFTLGEGRVALVLMSCARHARVDVTPGEPARIECEPELDRNTFQFTLDTFTLSDTAKGLEGQLEITPLQGS